MLLILSVGCSQKVISEEEAIQIAMKDLGIGKKKQHSLITNENSYDEEKQEQRFYLLKDEKTGYEYVIDAISGEIKEKNKS